MLDIPVPYERLMLFIEKLNLDETDIDRLKPLARHFLKRKEEFAEFFYNSFIGIPETRFILERHGHPERLKKVWSEWFESLFTRSLDREFHAYLWLVGLKHVGIDLDQRFSNLGFSLVRQFCHQIIVSDVPEGEKTAVLGITNRLIDLCVLIETGAFIEATIRCDLEVIKGIADKVRNPLTVIGGNIKRLQKKADPESTTYGIYTSLWDEVTLLEQMLIDIKTYNEIFGRVREYTFIHPEAPVRTALERLAPAIEQLGIKVKVELAGAPFMKADRRDLDQLFYYLLQNSMDAVDRENPVISITTSAANVPPQSVKIEIFNTGITVRPEEIERLFAPFYSTKPMGTGFGLPIAHLVIRRNYGRILFEPVTGQGTKVIIILPAAK